MMMVFDHLASVIVIGCKSIVWQWHDPQPTNPQHSCHEDRRRHCPLCLHLNMRSETGAVSSFILDPQSALLSGHRVLELPESAVETCLVTPLAHLGGDNRTNQGIVHFKGLSEMVQDMRSHYTGQQHGAERLVAAVDVITPEPVNKITAAQAKRPCARQDEPSDRVCVLSEAPLKC
jgi:hypothetical protein